jgi:hypothetical protein
MSPSGDNQIATVNTAVPTAPSVKIVDANNNPIAGVSVTFTPAAASGTVAPAAALTTNAQGVASLTSWTLGTAAGAQSLVVSSTGLTSVTIHATATAGAATKLGIVTQPADAGTSGVALPRQPTVQIQDVFGNAVALGTLQVTATPSAGSAAGNVVSASSTTGLATFTSLILTGTGSVAVVFSAPGMTPVTSTAVSLANTIPTQLLLVPATPTTFTFQAGSTPVSPPSIKVADAGGAGVSGIPVRIVVTLQGSSTVIQDGTANSDVNGVVTFVGTLPSKAATYAVTATSTSISGASVTATISVTAASAAKLAFVSVPASITAGAPMILSVQVQDRFDNVVGSATNAITIGVATGPGAMTGASANAAINGIETDTVSLGAAGTYTLSATSPGLTTATSANVVVSSGSVSGLRVSSQPATSVTNNAVFTSPTVQLVDANGNSVAVSGVVVTATIDNAGLSNSASRVVPVRPTRLRPPGPADFDYFALSDVATLRGTVLPTLFSNASTTVTATTDANGLATFTNLKAVGLVQAFSLKFTIASPSVSVWSNDVQLNAGAPVSMTANVATTQLVALAGTLGSYPSAIIRDISGNAVPSAATTVGYSVTGGACTVTGAPAARRA